MVNQKEVDKLVEILTKQVGKYNEKQIKGAILAEGYSEDTVSSVMQRLFPKPEVKQEVKPETKTEVKVESKEEVKDEPKTSSRPSRPIPQKEETKVVVQEVPKEAPKVETKVDVDKQDYYKEVNYLLDQLKSLNIVKKPEIQNPNLIKQETPVANVVAKPGDLNAQIDAKKQELLKIKIENDDDVKITLQDGKIINLNDYPRREWRNYRTNGKTLAETKEEQMSKLRSEIYALKKQAGRGNEVTQEEHISQKISDRVRLKSHGRIPEKRLEIVSKNEAERLREKYKSEDVERQDLDTAADNIYIQMMKNPNIYGDDSNEDSKKDDKKTDVKKDNTKIEEKKPEIKTENKNDEFNLDTNFSLDSPGSNSDLGNEFDLGLDLTQDNKKEKKK
jgi:hypothetical protein